MTTSHDNYVFFDIAGLKAFSFTETSHSITSGQPYHGVSAGMKMEDGHQQAYIMVDAGRKKSAAVAGWFKTAAGNGQTVVCDSAGTYPNELNFAVQGMMKITDTADRVIVCENFIVAQGHFGLNNNWWIASPTMQGAHVSISGAGLTVMPCGRRLSPGNGDIQPENALRESFQHRLHEHLAGSASAPRRNPEPGQAFPDRVLCRILDHR